jgi:hypothetical protein
MARPCKPEGERKLAIGVSMTPDQHETFKHLGGSRWLQQELDRLAEKVVSSKDRVQQKYPEATCIKNPAGYFGIYMSGRAALAHDINSLITGGWNAANQAWDRAAAITIGSQSHAPGASRKAA